MSTENITAPINPPYETWTKLWRTNTQKTAESGGELYAEPFEALFRVQRGLAGHVSFLATCDVNIVFTEYLLYEPILTILRQMRYEVQCEVPCDNQPAGALGDPRRVDFIATNAGAAFALEVKWLRWNDDDNRDYLDIKRDTDKLIEIQPPTRCFLSIFGRHSQIAEFHGGKAKAQIAKYEEVLPPLYADFRRTSYGCRVFQLKPDQAREP
jgi:hypothetical protein